MARRRTLSSAHVAPAMRRGHAKHHEQDEEGGNTESQQMLAVGSLLQKPKPDDKEVQHFRTKVAAERKRLNADLDQQLYRAKKEEMSRRNEIASTIVNALQTPNRLLQGSVPTFPTTTIAENAVHMPVADILAASENLVARYESLDNMVTGMRDDQAGPLADIWHQELQEAEKQLKMGARVTLRNVKKVLGADVEDEAICAKDEDEEMVNGEVGERELNYELQRGLRYAERGVKRMVKGLPIEEDC